ncbi:MAG: flagellar hook-basal body protein [Eubacteriales bacterium]
MFKGFYNAASGMLSQSRILNTVSNNISNVSTAGYKTDILRTVTFDEQLIARTGNFDKSKYSNLEKSASIRTAEELWTKYDEGMLEFTEMPLDAAILGKGFYHIKMADGKDRYTRNGSFNLDGEGYLCLQHIGRVMDVNNQPIKLDTDDISIDATGVIRRNADSSEVGRIKLVDFDNYAQNLRKADEGMFEATVQNSEIPATGTIRHKAIERSNVEASEEMLAMLASQRAFQSCSNIAKAYDQIMAKAVDLGAL